MKFLIICFALSPFFGISQSKTPIYVSAHPDDWQLFMNPAAFQSVKDSSSKVIFIHTTAGDAGNGMGNNNYTLAREEGSLRAIRFMCNSLVENIGLGANMNQESITINGHQIRRHAYANTVSYFLRLPDGNYYGEGYPLHDSTSLRRIYEGDKVSITAVDNSTSYTSLQDLKQTLIQLISLETQGSIHFNVAETDSVVNPGDHSDHLISSKIFQEIAEELEVESIRYYIEYATNSQPMNVVDEAFLISAGTWGATASGLSDMGHYSTWDPVHNSWIGRQYFREWIKK